MADLAGKPIPSDRNGAAVYAKVFKLFEGKQADGFITTLNNVLEQEGAVPTQAYEKAKAPVQWDDAKRAAIYFEGVAPLTEQAVARPECKFAVKWAGSDTLYPHLPRLRDLVCVLCAEAVLDAREGRKAEAFRKIELALIAARAAKDEPSLFGTLVTAAYTSTANKSLQAVLRHCAPDATQARRLYDVLSKTDFRREYVNTIKGERTKGLWFFGYLRDGRYWGLSSLIDGNDEAPNTVVGRCIRRVACYVWRPALYADESVYLKYMSQCIPEAAKPYRLARLQVLGAEWDVFPRYAVVTSILLPVYSGSSAAVDGVRAKTALTQVLLASQVYRSRAGSYPSSLGELHSKLGWKIPTDPFSGKSLSYKRTGQGFKVYSIGANLKDNGGTPTKTELSLDHMTGDVVLNWEH